MAALIKERNDNSLNVKYRLLTAIDLLDYNKT